MEKHNLGSTWTIAWPACGSGDSHGQMDLSLDVNKKQLPPQQAAPIQAAAPALKAAAPRMQAPAAGHSQLVDWLKTLMAAVPVEQQIRQLVSLSSADQQAVLAAASSAKRQRDSIATEPVGKKPKLTVKDVLESAKEAMTVMEGRPPPDSEVFAKERAKLYNALIASITRVCAGEEVIMKHVTSCFNRGAKLLSDGQLKSIRKRIADDQVVPLRWTKVLTGLDHTLDLADKAKQKKQLQLERQQQQAKQTKKKARSSGGGGGVYSDYSQLQQQAPPYSAQYLQQPPQYSMPQQQQQLGMQHQQQTGMQQQQQLGAPAPMPPPYMPSVYAPQQSLGMTSPSQYSPMDAQQQSLGMLNSNLHTPATHISSPHANHMQAW